MSLEMASPVKQVLPSDGVYGRISEIISQYDASCWVASPGKLYAFSLEGGGRITVNTETRLADIGDANSTHESRSGSNIEVLIALLKAKEQAYVQKIKDNIEQSIACLKNEGDPKKLPWEYDVAQGTITAQAHGTRMVGRRRLALTWNDNQYFEYSFSISSGGRPLEQTERLSAADAESIFERVSPSPNRADRKRIVDAVIDHYSKLSSDAFRAAVSVDSVRHGEALRADIEWNEPTATGPLELNGLILTWKQGSGSWYHGNRQAVIKGLGNDGVLSLYNEENQRIGAAIWERLTSECYSICRETFSIMRHNKFTFPSVFGDTTWDLKEGLPKGKTTGNAALEIGTDYQMYFDRIDDPYISLSGSHHSRENEPSERFQALVVYSYRASNGKPQLQLSIKYERGDKGKPWRTRLMGKRDDAIDFIDAALPGFKDGLNQLENPEGSPSKGLKQPLTQDMFHKLLTSPQESARRDSKKRARKGAATSKKGRDPAPEPDTTELAFKTIWTRCTIKSQQGEALKKGAPLQVWHQNGPELLVLTPAGKFAVVNAHELVKADE